MPIDFPVRKKLTNCRVHGVEYEFNYGYSQLYQIKIAPIDNFLTYNSLTHDDSNLKSSIFFGLP